jgi:DUF917 family protein
MRRILTIDDVEPAVLGGTVLGGGGGGHVADGLALGRLAVTDVVAICAGVGAPGAPDQFLQPVHYQRALDELQRQLAGDDVRVAALATNENGAMGTVNGWLQAALTGLPVVDAPCNGRAHPSALMGSLGLHRDDGYVATAGFAGGRPARYVQGSLSGSLASVSGTVRDASVAAGGIVAVARNPVPAARLARDGAPGGISQAIEVGRALLTDGVAGVAKALDGTVVAEGVVGGLELAQQGGFDVGRCRVGDVDLTIVNEYLSCRRGDQELARFPDLVMTFHEGRPLVSADLAEGMTVQVLVAPAESLRLSSTMAMRELIEPFELILAGGAPVGPVG